VAGALVLAGTTFLTERASREPSRELMKGAGQRSSAIEAARRNSETVTAMGLGETLSKRWLTLNESYLGAVERSSDVVSSYGSVSKVFRLLMQSAILGVGAYLVIRQQLTPGGMIAASIMMSRALAPIETAIANWRGFVSARDSVRRLSETLARLGPPPERTELPKPQRALDVEDVAAVAPDGQRPIVANVRFRLTAGDVLGIIGPSGSGKTSLVRVLVGIWRPGRGSVRMDGAAMDQWTPEMRGPYVGYLSQNVDLFDGTVAENIARMLPDPDADKVIAASQAAGAHDMILRLANGYDTRIGDAGAILSGGQRQRVALARALYGDPFLIVLDEPNANLDQEGEAALQQAIRSAKERGAIVVMIAHRTAILGVCDKVLVLKDGLQHAFGPRDEVLKALRVPPAGKPGAPAAPQQMPAVASMGATLKIVPETGGGAR
jgi:ATP-binding cassette subfamily C protein